MDEIVKEVFDKVNEEEVSSTEISKAEQAEELVDIVEQNIEEYNAEHYDKDESLNSEEAEMIW